MRVFRIFSGKWRRYFSWQNFIDPVFILLGFFQSLGILILHRPQVVFSKGGYVSLPVTFAAFLLRIPVILHESDRRMGMANRMASRFARFIFVAFPQLKAKNKKIRVTGNPIRSEVLEGEVKTGYQLTGFDSKKPVLLVWGGSQGAQQINDLLMADLERFTSFFQVVHITGQAHLGQKHPAHSYKSFSYLKEDLKHVYAITDMVIGRAGANSLFEIAALKKPNIIIPLANLDQQKNAAYFEQKKAGLVYQKTDNLFDLARDLWQNEALKKEMKIALEHLSKPHAAETIAELILSIAKGQKTLPKLT